MNLVSNISWFLLSVVILAFLVNLASSKWDTFSLRVRKALGSFALVIAVVAAASSIMAARGNTHDEFTGGCEPFNLYAQNQFVPVGTLVWTEPRPTADSRPAFAPNQIIAVDGWIRSRTPYPLNSAPWDSDVWFHLHNADGWVSFAGVRSIPTTPGIDRGLSAGAAPTDKECQGVFR